MPESAPDGLKSDQVLRFRLGGMFAQCSQLAGKFPEPIRVVSAIREQHRLRKHGAEKNRAQQIILRLAKREGALAISSCLPGFWLVLTGAADRPRHRIRLLPK